MGKIKVVYIAGIGRSGSTLLTKVLASVNEGFSLNELSFVWENGFDKNRLCSCGQPFRSCPFWTNVIKDIQLLGFENEHSLRHIGNAIPQNRNIPDVVLRPGKLNYKFPAFSSYKNVLKHLYASIYKNSGAGFLIDSSKIPSYGYAVQQTEDLDVYMIHLIRDPRAVAYSWKKEVSRTDGEENLTMEQYSILQTTIKWIWGNFITTLLKRTGKYFFIRYEDFCNQPELYTSKILDFIGVDKELNPVHGKTFTAGEEHSIWGNPIRMKTGKMEIKEDNEWKNKLGFSDRFWIVFLTWPFLFFYGYWGKWFKN